MQKIIRILIRINVKFHEDILYISYRKYIKTYFLISIIYILGKNFTWTTLKMIFSIFRFFLHPQIPDFQILPKPYINGKIINQISDDA